MSTVSAFTTRNYPRQSVDVNQFAKSVNLSFMLVFESDVIIVAHGKPRMFHACVDLELFCLA